MIIFAEMRALFASPREDYSSKFGFTFNNNRKEQEADFTSGGEKHCKNRSVTSRSRHRMNGALWITAYGNIGDGEGNPESVKLQLFLIIYKLNPFCH